MTQHFEKLVDIFVRQKSVTALRFTRTRGVPMNKTLFLISSCLQCLMFYIRTSGHSAVPTNFHMAVNRPVKQVEIRTSFKSRRRMTNSIDISE